MEKLDKKLLSIFNPYYLEKVQSVEQESIKFVQYTSAKSAMNIIKNATEYVVSN